MNGEQHAALVERVAKLESELAQLLCEFTQLKLALDEHRRQSGHIIQVYGDPNLRGGWVP